MKFLLSIVILFSLACKKEKLEISSCINEKIEILKTGCATGNTVKQFYFQNAFVYTTENGNCIADAGTGVYDENCNFIGSLGGLIGNDYINGINFYTNARFIKTIWNN